MISSMFQSFRFVLSFLAAIFPTVSESRADVDFAQQIKPLLSDRCFLCHGPDAEQRQAELRLDSAQGMRKPLASDESRYAVVPGIPEQSELVARIRSTDPDVMMPPPDSGLSLHPQDKALLEQWIRNGAEWQQHWSFEPITKPVIPDADPDPWVSSEIDHFILKRLRVAGLSPSAMASKSRLIRRLTFDLTGLPPTVAEIEAFLSDDTPGAYEALVDRLLASDRYGERMTADWLDAARYSDTYGYQVDRDRFVWPWRDWVINAFNSNMPYNQFITEQLAGDLLPNATQQQILATTFNRLHPQKVEGGSVPEEFRVEYVADRAQTAATAFMGLTMECARCHDHKYDPITQREYYQLYSFFNNIDEAGLYSYFTSSVPTPTLALPTAAQETQLKERTAALEQAESDLAAAQSRLSAAPQPQITAEQTHLLVSDVEKLIPGRIALLDFEDAVVGANHSVDGRFGKGVKLTGDHSLDVKQGNFTRWQPFTVSLWMNVPEVFERAVIFHRSRAWTDAGSRGYELLIEEGRLSAALIHFWPGNAIRIQQKHALSIREWHHVTMTYDGSSRANGLQLWVDGTRADVEIVRDHLHRNITGGGGDTINIGQRFRDVGFADGLIDQFSVFDRQLTPIEVRHLFDGESLTALLSGDVDQRPDTEAQMLSEYVASTQPGPVADKRAALQLARQALFQVQDELQEIMVMRERRQPRPAYLLARGAYDAPTTEVSSGVPASLPGLPEGASSDRLGLAQWLTMRDHPLTARVAVNRIWQACFGRGLVRTPEDFGSQGAVPTHPKLLDWLAADFRDHGWNVKRLIKQLVMSSTYRQDSQITTSAAAKDPENRLLGRAPVYRLSAEMLRDNALAVSGLLNATVGGAPVRPYELAASFKPSEPDTGSGLYRRSLYTYWKRTAPAPVMITLDAAKREVCRMQREQTASPLQALVVLNGPQFVEAARMLADRLIRQAGNNDRKIAEQMFLLLTSRHPTTTETTTLLELFDQQKAAFAANADGARQYLAVGEARATSGDESTLAAWASVANTLLAFDECMMKR